ncbi:hypothetical protein COV18_07165 [Candidatus Woesearchaeota archaeon CG10_big_fil_rev_8_21_14_0_10_37_12]|nr:MAG: hypothetical protein COV18_07165 [Candidatus Woesearchaeota archaeon CG10_big_fil_rev_8_21_14_0_10_37_12]
MFLLSIIILAETVTFEKTLGTLIVFAGVLILTYQHRQLFGRLSDKGVQLTLLASVLVAFVAIIDKLAMDYFTPGMFGFLVYLIPGLILLLFVRTRIRAAKKLITTKWLPVIGVIILGMTFYYFQLKALTCRNATRVYHEWFIGASGIPSMIKNHWSFFLMIF